MKQQISAIGRNALAKSLEQKRLLHSKTNSFMKSSLAPPEAVEHKIWGKGAKMQIVADFPPKTRTSQDMEKRRQNADRRQFPAKKQEGISCSTRKMQREHCATTREANGRAKTKARSKWTDKGLGTDSKTNNHAAGRNKGSFPSQ